METIGNIESERGPRLRRQCSSYGRTIGESWQEDAMEAATGPGTISKGSLPLGDQTSATLPATVGVTITTSSLNFPCAERPLTRCDLSPDSSVYVLLGSDSNEHYYSSMHQCQEPWKDRSDAG